MLSTVRIAAVPATHLLVLLLSYSSSAFQHLETPLLKINSLRNVGVVTSLFMTTGDNNDKTHKSSDHVILYSEEEKSSAEQQQQQQQQGEWKNNAKWNSLDPKIKLRMIDDAQKQAIQNKAKRESSADKKNRLTTWYKKAQLQKKKAARIPRPISINDPSRIALSAFSPGIQLNGTVISFANFGAYVDVNSQHCDGLLHVSQMSNTDFIEHPRQIMSPGDKITVWVLRANEEMKKLHLTMIPDNAIAPDKNNVEEDEDKITLNELGVNDELWGEIKRVTAYGAYVEIRSQVDGFLHFMDHPLFGLVPGAKPKEFMNVGDRIRCWVSNVNVDRKRIQLTANRPNGLPGPRRELLR